MSQDDLPEPGTPPKVTAPVQSDFQQPRFLPAGLEIRMIDDQADKNILCHILRLFTAAKIVIRNTEDIRRIKPVKLIK
jgi:hypothetical protein